MAPQQPDVAQPQSYFSRTRGNVIHAARTLVHHVKRHVGVGIICSVAYFDPGNWSVDLQAGSSFGYRPMLFVILMAGLGAIVLQTLASKLGCVTGLGEFLVCIFVLLGLILKSDLATHCRLLLHDHPRHPRLVRRLVLYPLYVLSEIAIISTDLAELLGSAIGFCLLFPKLPLWGGVALTSADVLIFLSFADPTKNQGRPLRVFEYTIIGLVLAVFGCFVALLVKANPNWSDVFMGYVPDKTLFQSQPDAVYAAVGILGATVMPHALFLGSSLATQDRVTDPPLIEPTELPSHPTNRMPLKTRIRRYVLSLFRITRAERVASNIDYRSKYGERENSPLSFIKQHLGHGVADVVTSLLALAVPINSAILILAASVFFQGTGQNHNNPAGLFDAHDLIKARIGDGAALIFALALVCAGQTSGITVTLAGQIVSEGFIEWKISPFFRRIITRCISLVPSMVIAVAVGREGINSLLVASQVVLSVVLPFVAFPLIYLTSTKVVMQVRKPAPEIVQTVDAPLQNLEPDLDPKLEPTPNDKQGGDVVSKTTVDDRIVECFKVEQSHTEQSDPRDSEYVDFSNSRLVTALAYVIWCIVLIANAYAIVMLFLR